MYSGNITFSDFVFEPNPYLMNVESNYADDEFSTAVSGEGEFSGSDAFFKFKLLKEVFLRGETAWLRMPMVKPLRAKLIELNLKEDARENKLSYYFKFQEVKEKNNSSTPISYATVSDEASLWDIEKIYGVDVAELLELNPDFPDCYCIEKGKRIRIA